MIRSTLCLFLISALLACNSGPSTEELKAHETMLQVGKEKKRIALQNMIDQIDQSLEQGHNQLSELQQFRFLRSPETKMAQVMHQLEEIGQIEQYKRALQNELAMIPVTKTYPCQDRPQDLMDYIFTSMSDDNLETLKYLIDPYGEHDEKLTAFLVVHLLPSNLRTGFTQSLKARVMPEPQIGGASAIYEIAVGPGQDRLEKVLLVKRMDKWYLQDIDL